MNVLHLFSIHDDITQNTIRGPERGKAQSELQFGPVQYSEVKDQFFNIRCLFTNNRIWRKILFDHGFAN